MNTRQQLTLDRIVRNLSIRNSEVETTDTKTKRGLRRGFLDVMIFSFMHDTVVFQLTPNGQAIHRFTFGPCEVCRENNFQNFYAFDEEDETEA